MVTLEDTGGYILSAGIIIRYSNQSDSALTLRSQRDRMVCTIV